MTLDCSGREALDDLVRPFYLLEGRNVPDFREMLFIPARAANLPINNKPVMLLSLVFAPTWLGLSFYDSRTTSLLHPARQIQLPSLQRGEGEAMLTALTHLSRSPLEQNIIQPLVLSLLHLCRNVVNMPPVSSFAIPKAMNSG